MKPLRRGWENTSQSPNLPRQHIALRYKEQPSGLEDNPEGRSVESSLKSWKLTDNTLQEQMDKGHFSGHRIRVWQLRVNARCVPHSEKGAQLVTVSQSQRCSATSLVCKVSPGRWSVTKTKSFVKKKCVCRQGDEAIECTRLGNKQQCWTCLLKTHHECTRGKDECAERLSMSPSKKRQKKGISMEKQEVYRPYQAPQGTCLWHLRMMLSPVSFTAPSNLSAPLHSPTHTSYFFSLNMNNLGWPQARNPPASTSKC